MLTWLGIAVCLSQSAILSGLNLGLFSLSRLELEVEARRGNHLARRVLALRKDANFTLATVLWGNVAVNVLLTLLSGSVLAGIWAFLFSTVVITICAEIVPQVYFSRHALAVGARLTPLLRIYKVLLYPVARPTAMALDAWLGGEEMRYFRERDLRRLIRLHMEASDSEIARVEGQGALNFLDIDDVRLADEGETLDRSSLLTLPFDGDLPRFPGLQSEVDNEFLWRLNGPGKSWMVLTDERGDPRMLLHVASFTRDALFGGAEFNPLHHCHRPIIVRDHDARLGDYLTRFRPRGGTDSEDIIDHDVILLWTEAPRIITGTDLMGRLLRGIAGTDRTPIA